MKLSLPINVLFAALLLTGSSTCMATPIPPAPIIDQPADLAGGTGFASDFSAPPPPGQPGPPQLSDNFIIDAPEQQQLFLNTSWYGFYVGDNFNAVDHFTVRIFNAPGNVAGPIPLPEADFGPGDLSIGREFFSFLGSTTIPIYRYSTRIPLNSILAIGSYALSVVNDTSGDNDQWLWWTSTIDAAPGGANSQKRFANGDTWSLLINNNTSAPVNLAFSITAVVPEPGSPAIISLLAIGLLGSISRHRRTQVND